MYIYIFTYLYIYIYTYVIITYWYCRGNFRHIFNLHLAAQVPVCSIQGFQVSLDKWPSVSLPTQLGRVWTTGWRYVKLGSNRWKWSVLLWMWITVFLYKNMYVCICIYIYICDIIYSRLSVDAHAGVCIPANLELFGESIGPSANPVTLQHGTDGPTWDGTRCQGLSTCVPSQGRSIAMWRLGISFW